MTLTCQEMPTLCEVILRIHRIKGQPQRSSAGRNGSLHHAFRCVNSAEHRYHVGFADSEAKQEDEVDGEELRERD